MTTVRSDTDVIIVGSTLGGLVTATYLARAGLRVVLLEEQTHRKRPVLLREPFLLPGLGAHGPVREVLRELALPLIEQREIRSEPVSVQVILPGARIDARPDTEALALELDGYKIGEPSVTTRWLELLADQATAVREELWRDSVPVSAGPARGPNLSQRLQRAVSARPASGAAVTTQQLDIPDSLRPFAEALVRGLSGCGEGLGPAPALLIDGACRANSRMPNSTTPFLDLFRRRFTQLHGEVWTVDQFDLISSRGELGVELPNRRAFTRSLVIAAPRAPLQSFLDEHGEAPRWLRKGLPVDTAAAEIFRAERDQLPVGLGTRVIVAPGAARDVTLAGVSSRPRSRGRRVVGGRRTRQSPTESRQSASRPGAVFDRWSGAGRPWAHAALGPGHARACLPDGRQPTAATPARAHRPGRPRTRARPGSRR